MTVLKADNKRLKEVEVPRAPPSKDIDIDLSSIRQEIERIRNTCVKQPVVHQPAKEREIIVNIEEADKTDLKKILKKLHLVEMENAKLKAEEVKIKWLEKLNAEL